MNVLKDGELLLYGTVGSDFFGDGFSALDVANALSEVGRKTAVNVRINSGGGDALEGLAIHSLLTAHKGTVTVFVDSIAASAASIIAMGGDEIVMRKGAMLMIHDPGGITIGNAADHEKTLEALDTIATSMADIYADRAGKSIEDARADMVEEIWLTADEAVSEGYADRTENGSRARNVVPFPYTAYKNAPDRIVALARKQGWTMKARASMAHSATPEEEDEDMANEKKGGAPNGATEDSEFQAKVTAEVERQLKARDDAAKEAAEKEAAEKTKTASNATAETPEAMATRIRAEEQKRMADITAACNLAGQPAKAATFIAEGKSLSEVVAALQAGRASGQKPQASSELSNHSTGGAKDGENGQDAKATWDKITSKINKRIAGRVAA